MYDLLLLNPLNNLNVYILRMKFGGSYITTSDKISIQVLSDNHYLSVISTNQLVQLLHSIT